MNLDEAREFFKKDVFATKTAGIVLEEVGEGYAKCSLEIGPRHMNAAGSVMGGAIFTLADFSLAAATNTPEKLTVTTTSEISYFAAPKGNRLYSECRVLKDGKRNCFTETTVTDSEGRIVAKVSACGTHL